MIHDGMKIPYVYKLVAELDERVARIEAKIKEGGAAANCESTRETDTVENGTGCPAGVPPSASQPEAGDGLARVIFDVLTAIHAPASYTERANRVAAAVRAHLAAQEPSEAEVRAAWEACIEVGSIESMRTALRAARKARNVDTSSL